MTAKKNSDSKQKPSSDVNSRRDFIKTGSIAGAAAAVGIGTPSLSLARSANVVGRNTIKLGLIGCGGRGTSASIQAMNTQSSSNVEVHAMADVFESRGKSSLEGLKEEKKIKKNDVGRLVVACIKLRCLLL